MIRHALCIGMIGGALVGCGSTPGGDAAASSTSSAGTGGSTLQSNADAPATPPGKPLAYLDGRPITMADLQTALLETAGGQVLTEVVLDRRIARRLAERGLTLTDPHVETERQIFLQQLDDDPDTAVRLMREIRDRRPRRFDAFLKRDASLRLLVRGEATVSDAAVRQAFEQRYGARYEARLIVVDRFNLANDIVRQARAAGDGGDGTFINLVLDHSSDQSRAQGGLLPSISPADPTWPAGVRDALVGMEPGQVSDPIALDKGFAILKLERKIEAQPVRLDDVRNELELRVRRNVERSLMQTLARSMLRDVDILVVDPTLKHSWTQQREALLNP